MNFLKAYLKPEEKDVKARRADSPSIPGQVHSIRPKTDTPRTRSGSSYPAGDFRNASMNDLIDMKCDVMCNWLHQQQLERMWSDRTVDEGIILKKSREEYTSCPRNLKQLRGGLYESVAKLNVRVRCQSYWASNPLTTTVRDDSQYPNHQNLLTTTRQIIGAIR